MNFTQLLFELKIENDIFSNYTETDFIKFEKRIKAERQINPEISSDLADRLLEVIHENPNELEEFIKIKSLVNIFLGKIEKPNILTEKSSFTYFFQKYLEDDLSYIFKQKVSKKDFLSLEYIMHFKQYFSDDFLYRIEEIFENKLSYANDFYAQRAFIKHAEYDFLAKQSFFSFINHINNFMIESYLSSIYNRIIDEFNENKKAKYSVEALVAFSFYKPDDVEFRYIIRKNKNIARERLKEIKSSESGFLSFGTVAVILFIVVRIVLIVSKSSSNTNSTPNIDFSKIISERNSLMHHRMNINDKKLIHYLKDNELDGKNNYKLIKKIKTGDIPFDVKLVEFNIDKYETFTLVNNTKHDLIVLEYERLNKRIKIEDARFIYSKDSIQISNFNDFENTIFSFYLGDDLATFKNPFFSETKQLDKKDKMTPESRFLKPIKGTEITLNTFLKLKNRTIISKKKNFLYIKSKGLKHNINGMDLFIKKDFFSIDLDKEVVNPIK